MSEEEFLQSVRPEGECLIWTRASGASKKQPDFRYGYALFDGRYTTAHRIAFRIHHGRWPNGVIHHKCRRTLCQNPAHLEEMSKSDHAFHHRRGTKTHCASGHEYTPANTIPRKTGRACRECGRIRQRAYLRRKNSIPSERWQSVPREPSQGTVLLLRRLAGGTRSE